MYIVMLQFLCQKRLYALRLGEGVEEGIGGAGGRVEVKVGVDEGEKGEGK